MVSFTTFTELFIFQQGNIHDLEVLIFVLKVILHDLGHALESLKVSLLVESLLNSWFNGYHGNSPGPDTDFPTAGRSMFNTSL